MMIPREHVSGNEIGMEWAKIGASRTRERWSMSREQEMLKSYEHRAGLSTGSTPPTRSGLLQTIRKTTPN